MADQDLVMDVEPEVEEKKSSKIIFIILGVVLLLAVIGGVTIFMLSGDDEASEAAPVKVKIKPAIYLSLRPSFVVNFANTAGKTRFMQVDVTLMGRDPKLMSALEAHMPLIKSRLVDVFQTQEFEELRTTEGKETMRNTALEELQALFVEELGDPSIEKLFFTAFVLQ